LTMNSESGWQIGIAPGGDSTLARFGLDATQVFVDSRITLWRDLPERQNCYLDLPDPQQDQRALRLHIKRYKPPHGPEADAEAHAIRMLQENHIETVPLVAWGTCTDGRGFLISRDLAGYVPADQAIRSGTPFPTIAPALARMAATLHRARLHHRDLYLCHFFLDPTDLSHQLHLIDPGRVARLPPFPLDRRWIVKDLAQLLYSMREVGLGRPMEQDILARYFAMTGTCCPWLLRLWLPLKVASIGRHDQRLRQRQPTRNISIK